MGAAYPAGAVVAVELDDGREFGVRIAGTGSAAQVAQLWSSAVGRFDHRHRDVRVAETLPTSTQYRVNLTELPGYQWLSILKHNI